jgi:hypothetical protein
LDFLVLSYEAKTQKEGTVKKSIFAPWLVRFYEWYHTYRRPDWWKFNHTRQQEDFCHFGRVVFFWAPLYWFFRRRFALGMRPWMPVVLAAYVLFTLAYPIYGILVASFTIYIGAMMLSPRQAERIGRFFTAGVVGGVRLWHVLLVALFAGISYLSPEAVLTVLILLSAGVVAFGTIILLIWGLVLFVRFLRRWIHFSVSIRFRVDLPKVKVSAPPVPVPVQNAAANIWGILSTAWHFLVVLKRKTICPWVTFKDGRIEFEFAPEPAKPSVLAEQMQRATEAVVSSASRAQTVSHPKPRAGHKKPPSGSKSIRPRRKKTKS